MTDTTRCAADWGSATPSQRCVLPAGHAAPHVDSWGKWSPAGPPEPQFGPGTAWGRKLEPGEVPPWQAAMGAELSPEALGQPGSRPEWVRSCGHPGCVMTTAHQHGQAAPAALTCQTCRGELYAGPIWDADGHETGVVELHHRYAGDIATCPDYASPTPDVSLALAPVTADAIAKILGA